MDGAVPEVQPERRAKYYPCQVRCYCCNAEEALSINRDDVRPTWDRVVPHGWGGLWQPDARLCDDSFYPLCKACLPKVTDYIQGLRGSHDA